MVTTFKGSESQQDWLTNFDFTSKIGPLGSVERQLLQEPEGLLQRPDVQVPRTLARVSTACC